MKTKVKKLNSFIYKGSTIEIYKIDNEYFANVKGECETYLFDSRDKAINYGIQKIKKIRGDI